MALAQEYTLFRTLDNFKDAINCLQFSADGRWLAAGGDEGRLAIFDFQSDDMGCKDVDIVDRVTVVSLLWHPSKHGALFAGYGHGIIMLYHVGATRQVGYSALSLLVGLPSRCSLNRFPSDILLRSIFLAP